LARIRTVKPEFWTSEQVMNLKRDTRLMFIGLWNFCDDAGRHSAEPRRIKAQVFPGDDDISSETIRGMLQELSTNDLIALYEVSGKPISRSPAGAGTNVLISHRNPTFQNRVPRAFLE
jgi:hypothetical protein